MTSTLPSNLTAGKVLARCGRVLLLSVVMVQQKVSDQELYDLLTDARGDRDSAKVEQLCRNAVTTIRAGLGVSEPVDVQVEPAVDPAAAELF